MTNAEPRGIVVVAGPPGSGKGTQCELLANALGWNHVSSGERFRAEIARGTELGRQIAPLLAAGSLVPDDLTLDIVVGALPPLVDRGVLLDGFPRTLAQAQGLMQRVPPAWVRLAIELVVPEAVSLARLHGRAREDDRVAVTRRRLAIYDTETRPALQWLASLDLLVKVDGNAPPDRVQQEIRRVVAPLAGGTVEPMDRSQAP